MSNSITRTYTFTDGTTAYGSQVDSEVQNIVNTINNADAGTSKWTTVSAANASTTPLVTDNLAGSNNIFEARINGTAKVTINSTGALAMGSSKITGLANGTASTDAAAFGQIPVFTDWASYSPTFAAFGTVTNLSAWWMQMGNQVFVNGYVTTGTVTGSTVKITLPATVASAKLPARSTLLGQARRLYSAAGPTSQAAIDVFNIFYDGSTTDGLFVAYQSGTSQFSKAAGTSILANGDGFSFQFSFPI